VEVPWRQVFICKVMIRLGKAVEHSAAEEPVMPIRLEANHVQTSLLIVANGPRHQCRDQPALHHKSASKSYLVPLLFDLIHSHGVGVALYDHMLVRSV
jgi:hypothetical protein